MMVIDLDLHYWNCFYHDVLLWDIGCFKAILIRET